MCSDRRCARLRSRRGAWPDGTLAGRIIPLEGYHMRAAQAVADLLAVVCRCIIAAPMPRLTERLNLVCCSASWTLSLSSTSPWSTTSLQVSPKPSPQPSSLNTQPFTPALNPQPSTLNPFHLSKPRNPYGRIKTPRSGRLLGATHSRRPRHGALVGAGQGGMSLAGSGGEREREEKRKEREEKGKRKKREEKRREEKRRESNHGRPRGGRIVAQGEEGRGKREEGRGK